MRVCEETTLGEIKMICLNHQKQNKDCETCSAYRFCMYQMTTSYPSGWKLTGCQTEEQNERTEIKK